MLYLPEREERNQVICLFLSTVEKALGTWSPLLFFNFEDVASFKSLCWNMSLTRVLTKM